MQRAPPLSQVILTRSAQAMICDAGIAHAAYGASKRSRSTMDGWITERMASADLCASQCNRPGSPTLTHLRCQTSLDRSQFTHEPSRDILLQRCLHASRSCSAQHSSRPIRHGNARRVRYIMV
jgi:hypothetical protein